MDSKELSIGDGCLSIVLYYSIELLVQFSDLYKVHVASTEFSTLNTELVVSFQ